MENISETKFVSYLFSVYFNKNLNPKISYLYSYISMYTILTNLFKSLKHLKQIKNDGI